jgi:hypothetical protein
LSTVDNEVLLNRLRFIYTPLCTMPRGQTNGHRALAHLLAPHSIATPKQAKEPIVATEITGQQFTMKGSFFWFLLLSCLNLSCGQSTERLQTNYPDNVGDIPFDKDLDDRSFKVCNESRTFQYYNSPKGFPFEGEKIKLTEIFEDAFRYKRFKNESGYVTIRFIVNCEGLTGRFRIQEMGSQFRQTKFDKNLLDALLQTTRNLKGWVIASNGVDNFDYYQYLTFKIEKGELIEILP